MFQHYQTSSPKPGWLTLSTYKKTTTTAGSKCHCGSIPFFCQLHSNITRSISALCMECIYIYKSGLSKVPKLFGVLRWYEVVWTLVWAIFFGSVAAVLWSIVSIQNMIHSHFKRQTMVRIPFLASGMREIPLGASGNLGYDYHLLHVDMSVSIFA